MADRPRRASTFAGLPCAIILSHGRNPSRSPPETVSKSCQNLSLRGHQPLVAEQTTPLPDARGSDAGHIETLPQRRCNRIVDGDAELSLQPLDKPRTAHVGADDCDRIAPFTRHRPRQTRDLLFL